MTLSRLPLSYCTNVHPGRTLDEVLDGLTTYTGPLRKRLGTPIAAGLWLPASVIDVLRTTPTEVQRLHETLNDLDLCCYTLNTFPFGDFHSERVKEQVYLPDWTDERRLRYTSDCARVLTQLLPDGVEGSLSTVPLGFKELSGVPDFTRRCIANLLTLVDDLTDLERETGRVVRLAIEPEPLCVLETTAECITFFEQLFAAAESQDRGDAARKYLGVCYDVCHQAVEFEQIGDSIAALAAAGIRINKVHLTCAVDAPDAGRDADKRAALRSFVENRYLHQVFARSPDGSIVHATDLSSELCESPPEEFIVASDWRVHFHVPVNAEDIGVLGTTRSELRDVISAVAGLDYAPHLEVETYTWDVMPGEHAPDLLTGLESELRATATLIDDARDQ